MTSVDSGVETGNDSNDSLVPQQQKVALFASENSSTASSSLAFFSCPPALQMDSDDGFSGGLGIAKIRSKKEPTSSPSLLSFRPSQPQHTIIRIDNDDEDDVQCPTIFFPKNVSFAENKGDGGFGLENTPSSNSTALALCSISMEKPIEFLKFDFPKAPTGLIDWQPARGLGNALQFVQNCYNISRGQYRASPYYLKNAIASAEAVAVVPRKGCYKNRSIGIRKLTKFNNDQLYIKLRRKKLFDAALLNNTELLQEYLDNGFPPNIQDCRQRTPLHIASVRGYTDMVRLLLQRGANPNMRDCLGNTPLHLAAVTNKLAVVTLLLEAGTDVLSPDNHGHNPLQLAQSKLRQLQSCNDKQCHDISKIKSQVQEILAMLMTYLKRQDTKQRMDDHLASICSKLSLSNTPDAVQDDVRNLLASIESLNLSSSN